MPMSRPTKGARSAGTAGADHGTSARAKRLLRGAPHGRRTAFAGSTGGAPWTSSDPAMDPERLRRLLESVAGGERAVPDALAELARLPYADLGFARVDHHRELRQGLPEVVLGLGKSVEQIVGIVERLAEASQ